jgi:O-antigen ligase
MEGFAELPFVFLPMDVVYFFTIAHLVLYAVLQPNRFLLLVKENPFLSIFLAIVLLYVLIYTPIHGKTALGEARKFYFMFLLPLLAFVSLRTSEDLRRFLMIVVLAAACLAVLGVFQGATARSLVRIQSASQTLIIALAMFVMIVHRIYKLVILTPRLDTALLVLFFVVIAWSGQRSVWLAVACGLLLMLFLYRRRPTTVAKTAVAMMGGSLVLVIGLTLFPNAGDQVLRGFAGIIDPYADHTASWRIEGWRQQLNRLVNRGNLWFGEGLGTYYRWEYEGARINVYPHNAFVQATLKFGLFGLMIYALLALHSFRKLLRARKVLAASPTKAYLDLSILNFGAGHAYCLGYGFAPVMLLFLAVGLSAATMCGKSYGARRLSSRSRTTLSRVGANGRGELNQRPLRGVTTNARALPEPSW